MIVQLYKFTKIHQTVHLKWVSFIIKKDNIYSLTFTECKPCIKYCSRYCGIIGEYKAPAVMKTSGKRQTNK